MNVTLSIFKRYIFQTTGIHWWNKQNLQKWPANGAAICAGDQIVSYTAWAPNAFSEKFAANSQEVYLQFSYRFSNLNSHSTFNCYFFLTQFFYLSVNLSFFNVAKYTLQQTWWTFNIFRNLNFYFFLIKSKSS